MQLNEVLKMRINNYAVKLIYRINYQKCDKLSDLISWEERVICVNASSFDDAFRKAEKFGIKYETEYENTLGETVKVRLAYTPNCYLSNLVDIEPGTEVYSSGFFDATEDEMNRLLDIMCNKKSNINA
ncbi:MAG TPA: hypothetical protein DEP70_03845 [Acholeplasmataceae bacterium]|nr:hypothetical protein [Acholeplasmataceae bacterium]